MVIQSSKDLCVPWLVWEGLIIRTLQDYHRLVDADTSQNLPHRKMSQVGILCMAREMQKEVARKRASFKGV